MRIGAVAPWCARHACPSWRRLIPAQKPYFRADHFKGGRSGWRAACSWLLKRVNSDIGLIVIRVTPAKATVRPAADRNPL